MNYLQTLNTLLSIALWLLFVKVFMGFGYFSFNKWYKRGNSYIKEHKQWMDDKP